MNKWISIKDKLPPEHEYVMIYDEEEKEITIDYRYSNSHIEGYLFYRRMYEDCSQITHWMKLPKLPK